MTPGFFFQLLFATETQIRACEACHLLVAERDQVTQHNFNVNSTVAQQHASEMLRPVV